MRNLKTFVLGLSLLLCFSAAKADEGMWLLSLLKKNASEMQEKGFKLTTEDIYSVNQSCIKDAIVGLGREGRPFSHFCTGEIISDQGLFLTNHHCGFGAIQSHSTPEHDYLLDGFWAYDKKDELTNPGITASILVRMADVTEEVLKNISDEMSEEARYSAIKEASSAIEKREEEGSHFRAKVKDMFNGNQYFVFVYEIYNDVRLVGAPPQAMGKFGGDTDNWMWPRHTADFALFRIYSGPDGKPATYSENNLPLKPKHHLPISIKGVEEGDFAMVMGFPGTTNRYLTSFGLEETMDITNKNRYEIRTVKLDILQEDMLKDPATRIKYASKYASCANYWKYSNEQNKALKKLNTMGHKKQIEQEFLKWANKKSKRTTKYGNALNLIKKAYAERKDESYQNLYIGEALASGAEAPFFAIKSSGLLGLLKAKNKDNEAIKLAIEAAKEAGKKFYKDYNASTDQKLMAGLFKFYADKIEMEKRPSIFRMIADIYNNDFKKFAQFAYANSIFATEQKFMDFLQNPKSETLENDILFKTGNSIRESYILAYQAMNKSAEELEKGKRLFVDALLQINKKKLMSPDANSSIRLTYGSVGGYEPRDGVYYYHTTTLKGVMEKEDPSSHEFVVPEKLKELYKAKDFGRYADKNGNLVTCFITDNDITGGNSGSPVINGNGELIGTAFDGNSEAMSGDIDFEEELQKCINVDIRYTLFIIDKFAGAQNIIDELTIVK